jgi:hypothetical protein
MGNVGKNKTDTAVNRTVRERFYSRDTNISASHIIENDPAQYEQVMTPVSQRAVYRALKRIYSKFGREYR